MLTKTKIINEEKNDLGTNHSFSIPENIQKDINEKGFHLYNWIGEQDVKQSIERDFLKLIIKKGIFFTLTLFLPSIIILYLNLYVAFYYYFFGILGLINIFLIIYLIGLSIKRSSILRNNNQILITDTAVSINGKIKNLENNKITSNYNLNNIGNLFEEKLFLESNIHKTKKQFSKQVKEQITNGYVKIGRMGRGKKGAQAMLLIGALYSVYALSLGFIYLFGIFFIWIFGNILSFVNKKILLISGHEITNINENFETIDKNSKKIIQYKNTLSTLLTSAINNDWEDSLLTKINSGIKNINVNASTAVNTSIELKDRIKNSKYQEMFNFAIYNSWIKKQILIPLEQISDLLQNNLNKLQENKSDIEKQILETTDQSLLGPLVASKTRTIMRIEDIETHMEGMRVYIDKLK